MMSPLISKQDASNRATESTDPKELLELYEQFQDSADVVKGIVNNRVCPDEIKKRYVLYALDRLRSYNTSGPNVGDILDATVKSLEAWQPIQRLATIPDVDQNDTEVMLLLEIIQKKKAVILYGPPGTSKTFIARIVSKALTNGDERRMEFVQFHASYAYEDFIEGIVPQPNGNGIIYKVEDKVFKSFCEQAVQQPSKNFVIIIDEINRADLSKVFGEVFTCLEYRGQSVRLLYSAGKAFQIPSNVIIIGTMNTIDRSTTDLDFALRRRFYFYEVPPRTYRLEQVITQNGKRTVDGAFLDAVKDVFSKTQQIYPLGHAYFKDVETTDDLKLLWDHQLKPLLEQYFEFDRGNVTKLEQLFSPLWAIKREYE